MLLYEITRVVKFVGTESKMMIVRGGGVGLLFYEYRISAFQDENTSGNRWWRWQCNVNIRNATE